MVGNLANMSNYDVISSRNRGRTLIVVEGNHEKNVLFQLLFRSFPELNIKMENVCVEEIFSLSTIHNVNEHVREILRNNIKSEELDTATYQLCDWIKKMQYLNLNKNLFGYLRTIFIKIIKCNIIKARNISVAETVYSFDKWQDYIEDVDLISILQKQNECSRNSTNGFIWVLNTCVFLVAEYNTRLIKF